MCFEKHIEEPARKVNVIIEQKNSGSQKQRHFLTLFAFDLADHIFGKDDREPIPQPEIKSDCGNEFYTVSFNGLTRVEPKDLKTYFRDENPLRSRPDTMIKVNYENPKTQFYVKSKP